MNKRSVLILCLMACTLASACGFGQMIANISKDVETDFGSYHPYAAVFNPQVPLFTIDSDFSNVENMDQFGELNTADSALLLENHFTVHWSQYKQLFDIYNDCTWDATPIFVTTDAVLHIYHVLYDQMLAEIEMQHFTEALDQMNTVLIEQAQLTYDQASDTDVREAARRNLAFFIVAQKLLNLIEVSVPEPVETLVDSELVYIEAHDGFHVSPVLGSFSALDYSQFKPRGHYTKNETLGAYFKAMMWYGWTIFTMEPRLFGDLARRHTLQALLITQMIYSLEADGEPLSTYWTSVYEPTVFFVGKTDDPGVKDYFSIAQSVYGSGFLSLSPEELNQESLIDAFMIEAQKLPEPAIPNWVYGTFTTYKGFRFMGQRFIPDSYMFAHLVLPDVDERYFPKGLDVMAVLGSDRAFTILDSVYQETAYTNYTAQIENFKSEYKNKSDEAWAQNLYWNWLYCLMPLLYQKTSGYPYFMQTTAWADKELFAALASWAELRHDTILYAKQSMTPLGIAPGPPKSYVEPNPYLYARLASLVRYTREGLEAFSLMPESYESKLNLFEDLLLFFRDVSVKELENVPLSDAEYENIYCFGDVMQDLVSTVNDPDTPWDFDVDDMAVVADVHTDSNSGKCLEEGVGYPLEIFVIVSEGGHVRITRGATFSYYEFKQPSVQRLTDEEWRGMLAGEMPPALPEWTESFMDPASNRPDLTSNSPDNLYWGEFNAVQTQDGPVKSARFQLMQNYPNPFNNSTLINFELPEAARVTLSIYNVLGQPVRTLLTGSLSAGPHRIQWDGRDESGSEAGTGLYICRLKTGEKMQNIKMFLLK